MEASKRKLGEDHPSTLTSMNNLAWPYWKTERLEEAKAFMRHYVPLLRAKLGASHPNYLSAAETLARWETWSLPCTHSEVPDVDWYLHW
jgi:hypothetical protein